MTPARYRVLDTVADGMAWAKSAIVGVSGCSPSVIEGLERAGALERLEVAPAPIVRPPDTNAPPPKLNPEQAAALADIRALDVNRFGVALLDGVTGGGKTEVFFEAVADTLRRAAADPAARDRADPYVPAALQRPARRRPSGIPT